MSDQVSTDNTTRNDPAKSQNASVNHEDRTGNEDQNNGVEEIPPATAVKLLLFLIWWFSGIGVGTGFMAPNIIGTQISAEIFLVIILANFCSMLLIIALIPGQDDSFPEPPADEEASDG